MKYPVLLILVFISTVTSGQNNTWQWALAAGSGSDDYIYGVSVNDSAKCLYATGSFEESITLGSVTLDASNAYKNCFVASLQSIDGSVNWARQIKGYYVEGLSVASLDNSIFILGHDDGVVSFDSLNTDSLPGPSVFIAEFLSDSSLVWFRHFYVGINLGPISGKLVIDGNKNLFYTCSFTDTLIQDSDTLISPGGSDAFVTKLDSSGNLIWTKSFHGINDDKGIDLSINNAGNLLFTGTYVNDLSVDTISINSLRRENFIAKMDTAGTVEWMNNLSGSDIAPVSVNDQGLILYVNNASSDSLYINDSLYIFPGNVSDILAFDINGDLQWMNQLDTQNIITVYDFEADSAGNFYFSSVTPDVGSGLGYHMITAKIDQQGNFLWMKEQPAAWYNAYSIDVDKKNDVYAGGRFAGLCSIDTITLFWNGDDDMWCGRLSDTSTVVNNILTYNNLEAGIFPNPSNGDYTIQLNEVSAKTTCNVTDITGRQADFIITDININSKMLHVNGAPGLYLLNITSENKNRVFRIIKF